MNTFIDVETIPCQLDWFQDEIEVSPPASYKKPESIAKWHATQGPAEKDRIWRESALNGAYGEIVVICTKTNGHTRAHFQSEDTDECRLLRTFSDWLETQLTKEGLHRSTPHYIGFNVMFDLTFLWKRMKIHGLHVPFPLFHTDVPWASKHVTDLQYLWCGARAEKGMTLDRLCKILGIQVDDQITGADVWDRWSAGDHEVVVDHCIADVERVHQLWRKLS